jgi:nitroreductase/NAD-dependent dihydropyrimidine dehydrogenase PreA subunit
MALIEFDLEKCNGCGICVKVCLDVLEHQGKGKPPLVVYPADCMDCGHCIMVCQFDAITHSRMDMANFPRIDEGIRVEPEKLVGLMRKRRSTRVYRKRPIRKSIIVDLIEAARYAPTGANAQSMKYVVLQDRNTLDELTRLTIETYRIGLGMVEPDANILDDDPLIYEGMRADASYYQPILDNYDQGEDPLFYRAPVLIVIHAHRDTPCPVEDSTLAAYNMMLSAESMGLGTCFIGLFYPRATRSKAIRTILEIPQKHEIYMAFTLGYPAVQYHRVSDRKVPRVRWI